MEDLEEGTMLAQWEGFAQKAQLHCLNIATLIV